MTVKDRLKIFIKSQNIAQSAFERAAGLSNGYINSLRETPSETKLRAIFEAFPHLNRVWLLTGVGEMLNIQSEDNAKYIGGVYVTASNDGETGHSVDIKENNERVTIIPLLPIAAQAGSLSCFAESIQLRDCERIVSPIKGADYAMRVSGDSMSPEYPNGSQVLIKKIDQRKFIDWGKVFVLDTYNGTVMKQLAPGSKQDRVKCISKNPDPIYAPFEVMWDDIIGVYRVLMCMSVK